MLSHTHGWVFRRYHRDGSSRGGPAAPTQREWPWWQQPGRLNTTAVPWQGHSAWDLPGARLILGVLRRGYFGPFALRESPAIFQPHWGYFCGRVIYTDWDNAVGTRLGSWSPKPCWVYNPLPKMGVERSPGCLLGLPANPSVPGMPTAGWTNLEPIPPPCHLLRELHGWAWSSSVPFLHRFLREMDRERLERVLG